jgi:MoaA/NifB/PqqE/SkfB family radical SAM enzyme
MNFDLEQYLNNGIERLVGDAMKVALKNPKQNAFFLRFAYASRDAAKRRHKFEQTGEHIPPFLIASITDNCNLHCVGCYAQANHGCAVPRELTVDVWERIFDEAEELGIPIILLAGGEPLLRRDVLEAAAQRQRILFPVFTNGTLLDDTALRLFGSHRNLIPIISIEGGETATDSRRGQGVYIQIIETMRRLQKRRLMFGVSITVTTGNLDTVTDNKFIDDLERAGCKVVLFVEYVPVEQEVLSLDDESRDKLAARIDNLRSQKDGLIIISFPGDEAESGGCLAAGRGFFHINASGGAEPCPFSPYSDLNLRDNSLREALQSPLFKRLREDGILAAKHIGGCVLFEHKEAVAKLLGV